MEKYATQYGPTTLEEIQAVYPLQPELDALFAAEQAAYREQLTRLGVPSELGADVIATSITRFEAPVSLAAAAAELGLSPARLSSSIGRLSPELAGLAHGRDAARPNP